MADARWQIADGEWRIANCEVEKFEPAMCLIFSVFQSELVGSVYFPSLRRETIPLFEKEGQGEIFRASDCFGNFKQIPLIPPFAKGEVKQLWWQFMLRLSADFRKTSA
jgi:hypothetical protein